MDDKELADLQKQRTETLFLCAENVVKYFSGDEQENELNKLKISVQECCKMETRQELAAEALERAKKETNPSNFSSLQTRFETHLEAMTASKLNVDSHPLMMELNKRVEKALQASTSAENG